MTAAPAWSIAAVAQDIATLIGAMAGQVLWTPGRRLWALALAKRPGFGIVCVDGGLALAHWYWPHHLVPGAEYPLDTLVRQLAARTRLVRDQDGRIAFPCVLDGAGCGSCCVMCDLGSSVLVIPDDARIAGDHARTWTAPNLPAQPPPERTPDWCDAAGPPADSLAALLERFQVPPEIALLPGSIRDQALSGAMQRFVERELLRQAVFSLPAPAWTADRGAISRALNEAAGALSARLGEPLVAAAGMAPTPPAAQPQAVRKAKAPNPSDVF